MTIIVTQAVAQALCDLVGGSVDGGKFRIYNGARPANPDTAVTTQTLLAEGTLNADAFAAAAMSGNVAVAAANAIADITGVAAGTATWFRLLTSANLAKYDGDVTLAAGAGDMKLTDTTIGVGSVLIVISFNLRVPTGQ